MNDDLRLIPRSRVKRVRFGTIVLSILAVITPVIGVVAVKAEVDASQAACLGANEAKHAADDILHQLYAQSQVPSDNADIQAARDQNAVRYGKLLTKFDKILAADEC